MSDPKLQDHASIEVVDAELCRRLRRFSLACAIAVVALACVVMFGWAIGAGTTWLVRVAPSWPIIGPLTATSLGLGGSAVLLARTRGHSQILARAFGVLLLVLALATLAEYVFGIDLGFDRTLLRTAAEMEMVYPGRIPPHTAIALALVGAALAVPAARRGRVLGDVLAVCAGLVAVTAAIGYAYGVPALYRLDAPVGMAVVTAVGLLLLAFAIVFADPERGAFRVVVHRTTGAMLARRLLPAATIVPLVLGFALLVAAPATSAFGVAVGASLLVVATVALLAILILHTTTVLDRGDVARLATEQALFEERSRLATILEHAASGIVYVDARDRREIANPAAAALVGNTGGSIDNVEMTDLYGRPVPRDEHPVTRALRGENVASAELSLVQRDGRRRPITVSGTPVRDARGQLVGAVFVLEDLSTRKELDRLRADFAAIVAHDLRSPISAILMNSELALRSADGQAAVTVPVHYITRIRRSAARLGSMVTEMLIASRIDLGRLVLDPKPVDAVRTVRQVLDELAPVIGDHRVDLAVERVPPFAFVDVVRLGQIVANLVENAVHASPVEASICVLVREARGGVELAVVDHGRGIAPGELPLLFDRAHQIKHSRETKSGLGLGLYIVKGLVEALGGKIQVDSALGRGSTFTVWLPAAPVESHSAPGDVVRAAAPTEAR